MPFGFVGQRPRYVVRGGHACQLSVASAPAVPVCAETTPQITPPVTPAKHATCADTGTSRHQRLRQHPPKRVLGAETRQRGGGGNPNAAKPPEGSSSPATNNGSGNTTPTPPRRPEGSAPGMFLGISPQQAAETGRRGRRHHNASPCCRLNTRAPALPAHQRVPPQAAAESVAQPSKRMPPHNPINRVGNIIYNSPCLRSSHMTTRTAGGAPATVSRCPSERPASARLLSRLWPNSTRAGAGCCRCGIAGSRRVAARSI